MQKYGEIGLGVGIGSFLLAGAIWGFLPLGLTEVLGFVSGAWCVWLVVKENIWNWPIGIANNIFFIFLFVDARLYGDMVLQVIYIGLGGLGWYWWLHGGSARGRLEVSRVGRRELALVGLLLVGATLGLMLGLQAINGAVPFLDALTTTLSLAAQYLLTRKLIENWYLWIAADIIYVGLYAYKGLYLTSLLYALFLVMCLVGLATWRKAVRPRLSVRPMPPTLPLTPAEAEVIHG